MQLLAVGIALTLGLLAAASWNTWRVWRDWNDVATTDVRLTRLAGVVVHLDEVLTMSARMSAETGDSRWEQRYRHFEPELDAAIEEIESAAPSSYSPESASQTKLANDALVALELRAFELVRAGNNREASAILSKPAYEEQKAIYADGMRRLTSAVRERLDERTRAHRNNTVASICIGLLLSLMLAHIWWRIVVQVKDHLHARELAEAAAVRAHASLEARVEERTRKLAETAEDLRREMAAREIIQAELRQAQKLEAIGRLSAGIAHEISTPIQFIGDNLHFVRSSVTSLYGVLNQYQGLRAAAEAEPRLATLAHDIARAEKSADLRYLAADIPDAIESSLEGIQRVADIIRSVKQFAHPGFDEKDTVDLNATIANAMKMARGEYKAVADVELDLAPLPPVRCYSGRLNQAILNIVVNAAHAIGEVSKRTRKKGKLVVRTAQDGDAVRVSISDTGPGVPESVRDKIFEPFFTTKEPGRGTGQGLAIAQSVVAMHKGSITFETEVGVGTTFNLRIPIDAPEREVERAA